MYSKIISGTALGIDGLLVSVETDISQGLPGLSLVGYLASSVKEAGERGKTGQLPMDELDQWPREAIESQLAGNQEEIRTIQDRLEVLRAENQALQKRLAQLNEAEQKESEARILSSMLLNSGLSTDEIIKKLGL